MSSFQQRRQIYLDRRLLTASRAVSADLKTRYQDMEVAVAFDLSLDAVEEVALELLHLAATQTCHVHVVALRAPLVKVSLALHVQQVQFVDQAVTL